MVRKKYWFIILMLICLDSMSQCIKETGLMYPDDFQSLRTRHTYLAWK